MNSRPPGDRSLSKSIYYIDDNKRLKHMHIRYIATNKLYHKKWIYRIKCKNLCIQSPAWKFEQDLKDEFLSWLNKFYFLPNMQIRHEGYFIFLYFNDKTLLENIKDQYSWIVECSAPETDEIEQLLLTSDCSIKLCNRYYRGEYQYKIYINTRTGAEIKEKFKEWMNQYTDHRFYLPKTSMKWLNTSHRWITDSPYVYVKDSKTVSMVSLMLGSNVKRVEKYILKNSINNTTSENLENVSL